MFPPRLNLRASLAFGHDLIAVALAWCLAYWLRFNMDFEHPQLPSMWRTLPWVVLSQALIFLWFGLYRGIWRYASLPDLKRILLAVASAAMAAPLVLLMLRIPALVPRSVLVLDPILLFLIMCGSRIAYRLWKERRLYSFANLQAKPVIVLGAGDAAAGLVKDLDRSLEWRVVGLLDDDPEKRGLLLHGVKVLGRIDELPAAAGKLQVQHVIFAMPSVSHAVRKQAMDICVAAGVKVLTVPSFDDLLSGKVTISQIRQVELDDLLGRDPVALDSHGLRDLLDLHDDRVRRERKPGPLLDLRHRRHAPDRVLVVLEADLLEGAGMSDRLRHGPVRVRVEAEQVVGEGVAQGACRLDLVGGSEDATLELDRPEAVEVDELAAVVDHLVRRVHGIAVARAVAIEEVGGERNLGADGAAEQLVDGTADGLALDVEAGELQRCEPLRQILVERDLRRVVDGPADLLGPEGVLAERALLHRLDQRVVRRAAAADLAEAGDPLVGLHLDQRADEPSRVDAVGVAQRRFERDRDRRRPDVGDPHAAGLDFVERPTYGVSATEARLFRTMRQKAT